MGLRLSDNRHGESDDSSRQQHLEQHAHLSSRPGELSILYAGFIYYLESGKLELMYVLVCFILCVCEGDGLLRGKGLRDHARAGRQLCAGDLRRTDRIFIRWYVLLRMKQ